MIWLGSSKVNVRGNSLSVTIPKVVAENYDIKQGDSVSFYSVSNLEELKGLDLRKVVILVRGDLDE